MVNTFGKHMRKKFTKGVKTVQFVLTIHGIKIMSNERTLVKNGWISSIDYKKVLFTKNELQAKEPRLSNWSLVQWKNYED